MHAGRATYVTRAVAALALVLSVAAGCGKKSGAARLEGHWRGAKVEGVAPDQQEAANVFATHTELSVTGDSLSLSTPTTGKVTSKFHVVREDKKTLVVVTDADGTKDEQTFAFDDDQTVKWKIAEGKLMTFRKIPD